MRDTKIRLNSLFKHALQELSVEGFEFCHEMMIWKKREQGWVLEREIAQ